ncbi:MAG: hypothetical protein ACQEP6_02470, partial [Patescibacteria group bacterium]
MDEKNKKKEVEYIRSQREKGVSDEAIRKALLSAGWSEGDISIGFAEVDGEASAESSQKNEEPEEEKPETEPQTASPSSQQPSSKESASSFTQTDQTKEQTETPEQQDTPNSSVQAEENPSTDTSSEDPSTRSTQTSGATTEDGAYSVGMSTGGDMNRKSGNSNTAKYILIAVIIILVIGVASAAAYFALGMRSGSIDGMSKEEVIKEALLSYMEADSLKNDTSIDISIEDRLNLNASFNGYYEDAEDVFGTKASLDFGGGVNFKEGGMTIEMDTEGEARIVDGILYARISKVPEIPFSGEDYSDVEGEWMHLDLKEETSEKDREQLEEAFGANGEVIEMVDKHAVQVLELAQEEGFLSIGSSVEDGDHIYEMDLDLEKAPSFFRKLAEVAPEEEYSEALNEAADEMEADWEDFKSDIDMGSDGYIIPLKIRVDGDSGHLKEFLIDLSLTVKANENLKFFGIEEDLKINILLNSKFSDIGEILEVEEPEDSKSFEELFEQTSGLSPTEEKTAQESNNDRTSEEDTVKASLEDVRSVAKKYDQPYRGFCEEKEDVREAIEEAIGRSSADGSISDYCIDGEDYWVVVVPEEDGMVSCADSRGVIFRSPQKFE